MAFATQRSSASATPGPRFPLHGPITVQLSAPEYSRTHLRCKILTYLFNLSRTANHPPHAGRTWETAINNGQELEYQYRVFHRGVYELVDVDLVEVEGIHRGVFWAEARWYVYGRECRFSVLVERMGRPDWEALVMALQAGLNDLGGEGKERGEEV